MPDGWDEDLSVQVEGAALQEMLSSLVRWTNAHASVRSVLLHDTLFLTNVIVTERCIDERCVTFSVRR